MPIAVGRIADDLTQAVNAFDRAEAERICAELLRALRQEGLVVPPGDARRMLGALRRKRYFPLMEQLADAFIRAGDASPQVWRQYAQALLDQDKITAALGVLAQLVQATRDDPDENAEAHGLIGRAHKQDYVHGGGSRARGAEALGRALVEYRTAFERDRSRNLWHGINVVACACRAVQDGIPLPGGVDPLGTAHEILARIDGRAASDVSGWDLATAAEACVALKRWDEAVKWLGLYVKSPAIDAFELASTLRQLRDIWRLDAGSPRERSLVALVQAALAMKEGGEVELAAEELEPRRLDPVRDALEAQLGPDGVVPLALLQKGIGLCGSVVHVTTIGDRSFGTGFVVRASDLRDGASDELLVLTNAHVIADDETVRAGAALPPLRSAEAKLTFEVTGQSYRVKAVRWTSPPGVLDACLVSTDRPIRPSAPCPLEPATDRVAEVYRRVYLIGHPGGGKLSFSLNDNVVLAFEDPRLHYRAPTEKGSSGSPVFSLDWNVLGLHHAGSTQMRRLNGEEGTYPANEGIWIHAIKRALAAEWKAPPARERARAPRRARR
jgi:hypothetical protein